MNQNEFKVFSELLSGVADYYGKPLLPAGIQIYWNALYGFDLDIVRALLSEHVKASKFMPAVSELLDRLKAQDGRPGPEEAWALIPKDESGSVVWTDEMAAAFDVASALMAEGEMIAARMAFLEHYRTAVRTARDVGLPVKWTPSLGHDVFGRETVLLEAVMRGRLTREHVAGLLPHRVDPTPEIAPLLPDLTQPLEHRSLKAALAEAKRRTA